MQEFRESTQIETAEASYRYAKEELAIAQARVRGAWLELRQLRKSQKKRVIKMGSPEFKEFLENRHKRMLVRAHAFLDQRNRGMTLADIGRLNNLSHTQVSHLIKLARHVPVGTTRKEYYSRSWLANATPTAEHSQPSDPSA